MFTFMCFSATFFAAFANTVELQMGNHSSRRGRSLFQKRLVVLRGLQQVFLPSLQQFPLFFPWLRLNAPGVPEHSLFASRGSSAASSNDPQDQPERCFPTLRPHSPKAPVSPSLFCFPSSPGPEMSCLFPCRSPIISAGDEVGRSCAVLLPGEHQGDGGSSRRDPTMGTGTWGQGPPAPAGCGEEVPPCSGLFL